MSKTTIGRRGPDDPMLINARKADLIALGYPWPENLEGKLLWWLDAEIKAMTSKASPPRDRANN